MAELAVAATATADDAADLHVVGRVSEHHLRALGAHEAFVGGTVERVALFPAKHYVTPYDTIQRATQGTVVPETFTHGSAAQRSGATAVIDTLDAGALNAEIEVI